MCFRSKVAVALKHTSQYKVKRNRQGGAKNNAGWVGDLVRISFGGKARLVSTTGVTTGQPALCSVHCCWCWSPKFGKSGDVGLPALVASLMQLRPWPDHTIQESAVIYKIQFFLFLCCKSFKSHSIHLNNSLVENL